MSATRLLVLGVVRMHGDAHGYQVRQALLNWAADRWANVKPGSIYHALKKLAAENLLEAVRTEESDLGPERTAYRITDAGEGEYFLLLRNAITQADSGPLMLNAALPFITTLDRRAAITLFTTRVHQVRSQASSSTYLQDSPLGKPAHVREMFQYWATLAGAEANWLDELIGRLEAGEYEFADDDVPAFGQPPA